MPMLVLSCINEHSGLFEAKTAYYKSKRKCIFNNTTENNTFIDNINVQIQKQNYVQIKNKPENMRNTYKFI